MAESYVRGYNEIILGFGKVFSKFSERKIEKLQQIKLIDLNYEEPLLGGEKISIRDFIKEHNEMVDEILVSNPENDKIIVESLMKEMKKKGCEPPSSEQVILQELGYDLREKTEMMVELIAKQRDTLSYFIESHSDRMKAMKPTKLRVNKKSIKKVKKRKTIKTRKIKNGMLKKMFAFLKMYIVRRLLLPNNNRKILTKSQL